MKVLLQRQNQDVHFAASGMTPVKVNIDGAPGMGGIDAGARPMELVLMALGGCSAIDVVSILKKQRQPVEDLQIEVEGEREPDAVPAPFKKIHMKFLFKGQLDEEKIKRAIQLSVEKYCSVQVMLAPTVEITWSYTVVTQ
ncbi:MAG: OsmC family protein [Bacteroidota bacterium]